MGQLGTISTSVSTCSARLGAEAGKTRTRADQEVRQSYYDYRNPVSASTRSFAVTPRRMPPSMTAQKLDEVLDKSSTGNEVWLDSAYLSAESEAKLRKEGYKNRIHHRGTRSQPLSQRQQGATTTRWCALASNTCLPIRK